MILRVQKSSSSQARGWVKLHLTTHKAKEYPYPVLPFLFRFFINLDITKEEIEIVLAEYFLTADALELHLVEDVEAVIHHGKHLIDKEEKAACVQKAKEYFEETWRRKGSNNNVRTALVNIVRNLGVDEDVWFLEILRNPKMDEPGYSEAFHAAVGNKLPEAVSAALELLDNVDRNDLHAAAQVIYLLSEHEAFGLVKAEKEKQVLARAVKAILASEDDSYLTRMYKRETRECLEGSKELQELVGQEL